MLGPVCSALWFVFYALVLSSLQEAHDQGNAYAQFREQLPPGRGRAAGRQHHAGSPVALIDTPELGVHNVVIVEGTPPATSIGPGSQAGHSAAGSGRSISDLGRAQLFGGPFGDIARPGPAPRSRSPPARASTYVVKDVRHVGDPFPLPTGRRVGPAHAGDLRGRRLANGWTPKRAVYVDAALKSKAVAVRRPAGRGARGREGDAGRRGALSCSCSGSRC